MFRGRKKQRAATPAALQGDQEPVAQPPKAAKAKKPAKAKGIPRPKGPARQTRMTRLVGLAFCIGGFVAIGVGWAGAANKDCVECQMPYVLSGGAIGIGLIVFGVGMMVMAQLRTEGRRLGERLEQWRSVALSRDSSQPAPDGPVPSPTEDADRPSVEPGRPSQEPGPPPVTNRAGPGSPG